MALVRVLGDNALENKVLGPITLPSPEGEGNNLPVLSGGEGNNV